MRNRETVKLVLAGLCLVGGCVYYVPQTETAGSQQPAATTAAGAGEVIVSGGEGTEVLVEGVAALPAQGGADIARDHAISDGLRKAVEQAVGTCVSAVTRVENFELLSDRIYTQTEGYVASYRIVTEGLEGGLYRVVMRAKVKFGKVENDLAAISILVKEQGRPRIMVVVKELENWADFAVDDRLMSQSLLETMIVGCFQKKRFPVVDAATVRQNLEREELRKILEGDNEAAVLVGLKTGAEVAVAGTAQRSSERRKLPHSDTDRDFHKVKLSVRAVNTETGEIVGASALTREVMASEDEARRLAADSASAELIAAILAGWTRHENVTEIHADNASYEKVQRFKSEVQVKLRGVIKVISRDLVGSTAVIEVLSETSSQEVLDGLGTRGLEIPFEVKGFAGNRIEIRFEDDGGGK